MCYISGKMWFHTICIFGFLQILLCSAEDKAGLDDNTKNIEDFLLSLAVPEDQLDLCDHESGKEAKCVKISRCQQEEKPDDDVTTRFIPRSDDCNYLEVCCPIENIKTIEIKPPPPKFVGCGYSNPGVAILREAADAYGRAEFGEFRWMIVLLSKDSGSFKDIYKGGGTLIHPSVVITAAHKVDTIDPWKLKCRAGEWDITSTKEFYKHQERDVKDITIHEDYLKAHAHNDVALVILKEPFELEGAPHIGLACLEPTLPSPGTECYSMGWGEDFVNGDQYANILKKLQLPLVDAKSCQKSYRKTVLGKNYILRKSLTCAGGEANVDTCIGDGGSSLVCPIADTVGKRYSVVGMVAYGLECGTEDVPGVYVKIPEVYPWVIRKMSALGFTERTYVYELK